MKKYSLYTIVFVILAILVAVNLASVYFEFSQRWKDFLDLAIWDKTNLAKTIDETISSPVWTSRVELWSEKTFIKGMAKFQDVRYIRIVRLDGSVYQSSIDEDWAKTINDPDIQRAIVSKETIVRDEVFNGEKLKTIIYPGFEDRTIWIGFSLGTIEKNTRDILMRDMVATLLGLLFTVVVIFLILRSIVEPLRRMTLACQEIRKGNLEIKVPASTRTEIGELATTFNEMAQDLNRSRAALEEAKTVLEVKVEARTKELKELNEGLEEEVAMRTKEIKEKMVELERFQKLAVGRELKMIELKKEIKNLQKKLEDLGK